MLRPWSTLVYRLRLRRVECQRPAILRKLTSASAPPPLELPFALDELLLLADVVFAPLPLLALPPVLAPLELVPEVLPEEPWLAVPLWSCPL